MRPRPTAILIDELNAGDLDCMSNFFRPAVARLESIDGEFGGRSQADLAIDRNSIDTAAACENFSGDIGRAICAGEFGNFVQSLGALHEVCEGSVQTGHAGPLNDH